MSRERIFTILIACVFFAGACAMKTKTVPAVGAEAGKTLAADGTPATGSATGPAGLSIDRLEEELQRVLAVSESISLNLSCVSQVGIIELGYTN